MRIRLFRLRFVRDLLLTSGTQALKAALAMAAGIAVARYYGAAARGTLSVLIALGSMTLVLGTLGLHASSIYFMGRYTERREAVASNNVIAGVVGGLSCTLALLGVGLAFRAELLTGIRTQLFVIFLAAVPFMYLNAFVQRIILGVGSVRGFNVADVVEGVGLLAGTGVAAIVFGRQLAPLIAVRIVIELAITVAMLVYLRRLLSLRLKVDVAILRDQLAYGIRNYASSLLWLFLLQSDVVLCNHFLGSAPTGVYSVAVSLGLPVTMIANAVGTLTFQRTSAEQARHTRVANTNRSLRLLTPLVAVPMILFGLFVHPIVLILYGDRFGGAASALVLLLPGLFAFSIEIVLINFLAGEGSPAVIYLGPLAGLAVNVAANLFVIPRWGIDGAAATSSVGYSIVLVMLLAYYMRSTGSTLGDMFVARSQDVAHLIGERPRKDGSGLARKATVER